MAQQSTQTPPVIEAKPLYTDGDYGVYQLHALDAATMDVVFFHGLQTDSANTKNAWWQTWMTAADSSAGAASVCWPKEWLPKKFPHARILSVCYQANAFRRAFDGKNHWETLGRSVLNYLTSGNVGVGEGGRSVFLVGHSMGGLIIKQLLLEAHFLAAVKPAEAVQEAQLLKCVRGVAFYATPHSGVFDPEWIRSTFVLNSIPKQGEPEEALLKRLEVFNEDTNELNGKFYKVLERERMKALCFTENKKTPLPNDKWVKVVEQGAAHLDFAKNVSITADHSTICRPRIETDSSFLTLVDFINEIQEAHSASQPYGFLT